MVTKFDLDLTGASPVATLTNDDGTIVTLTTAPVVSDEKVVVTHADGTTQEFDPKA